jgi:hypothetical protein
MYWILWIIKLTSIDMLWEKLRNSKNFSLARQKLSQNLKEENKAPGKTTARRFKPQKTLSFYKIPA